MGMYCEKKTVIRWSMTMKFRVPDLEVDQKTWREIVENDCQAHKLNREDAMDCKRWRKQIRDDWCEWMNVSSRMAHPVCPGQNPEARKTVVCVCVLHYSTLRYVSMKS